MPATASAAAPPAAGRLLLIRVAGVAGFGLAAALGAQVAIPLPQTPVPITLQTLPVLLAGAALGPGYGALSMGLYVVLGTVGYHVFAGGAWGLPTLLGATGGYLVGFIIAPAAVGALTGRPAGAGRRWLRLLAALLAGKAAIYACGLAWLHVWAGATLAQTLAWGLWPFVPGLVLKTLLAAGLAGGLAPAVRKWFD